MENQETQSVLAVIDKSALPVEIECSQTKFAVFGELSRRNTVYIKSRNASIELLGSYPKESIETSGRNWILFIIDIIADLLGSCKQWVSSISFPTSKEDLATSRLVLVWEGVASKSDISRVKESLDRNAIDVSTAVNRGDISQAIISLAPVVAECGRINNRNKKIQIVIWFIFIIALLRFLFWV
jgi:hypothetical protein